MAHTQLVRGVSLHRLGRLADSEKSLKEALDVFRSADALGDLSSTYSELSLVQSEMGNWRDAYTSLTQYKLISDRLLNNQLDQRFATLKVEFDTAAKEQENALLTRENEANEKALTQGRPRAAASGCGDRFDCVARGVARDCRHPAAARDATHAQTGAD